MGNLYDGGSKQAKLLITKFCLKLTGLDKGLICMEKKDNWTLRYKISNIIKVCITKFFK